MGHGTVVGPGYRPGYLEVKFENRERYDIRARNLTIVVTPRENPEEDILKGLRIGDAVHFEEGRGIIVDKGDPPSYTSPGTVMVKFGGVGVRSVRRDQVTKVMPRDLAGSTPTKESAEAAAAWALEWARVPTDDGEYERKQTKKAHGLKLGDYVKVKAGPWKNMNIGLLKKFGDAPAPGELPETATVMFDVMGDEWTFKCEDLEAVKDPGFCKFKHETRELAL